MKRKTKAGLLFLFCAAAVVQAVYAQDALEIVRASRNRIEAESTMTRSSMVTKDKNGRETVRTIDQISKDGPNGESRAVIVFVEPRSVAGIRFLTVENLGRDDDRWLYLPEVGRVRRIPASDGAQSFQGTAFSNDDISSASRNVDLDQHSLLREENLGPYPCYVIQSVPKDQAYQYSKMIQWIDKNTKVSHKVELYDKRNVHVKTLEILRLADQGGRLTPMETRMTNHVEGTSTQINVERIAYNSSNVREGMFTQEFLSTGRY
jgi:outer membrane lipoprotein-sorting protein